MLGIQCACGLNHSPMLQCLVNSICRSKDACDLSINILHVPLIEAHSFAANSIPERTGYTCFARQPAHPDRTFATQHESWILGALASTCTHTRGVQHTLFGWCPAAIAAATPQTRQQTLHVAPNADSEHMLTSSIDTGPVRFVVYCASRLRACILECACLPSGKATHYDRKSHAMCDTDSAIRLRSLTYHCRGPVHKRTDSTENVPAH